MTADRFTKTPGIPRGGETGDPQTMVSGRMLAARRPAFGPPRELGAYFLSSPICMDALGETWAGYATRGIDRGRMVLVTVVSVVRRSRAIEELLEAAQSAASIRHPEVLALLDVQETDSELALVSEYIEGAPLSTLLASSARKGTPFQEAVAVRIGLDAARALWQLREATREANCGGVSPEIFYLPTYGELLLRHPRLSEVAMQQLYLRRQPSCLPYRSPEQLRNPREIDERADVFSLGILLWEMLAMRPLFGEESHVAFGQCRDFSSLSPQDVERKIRSFPIPDLMKVPRPGAALNADVVSLVARCLQRDPGKRYSSLKELCRALEALPRGLIADTRAVASTVDRLGGEMIRQRQEHMSKVAPMPLRSSAPPSGRASHFPDENAQVTVSLPQRIDDRRLKDLMIQSDLGLDLPPSTDDPWRLVEETESVLPKSILDDNPKAPARREEELPLASAGAISSGAPPSAPAGALLPTAPAEALEDHSFEEDVSPSSTERSQPSSERESARSGAAAPAIELPPHHRHAGSWRPAVAVSVLLCGGAFGAWATLVPSPNENSDEQGESAPMEKASGEGSEARVASDPTPDAPDETSSKEAPTLGGDTPDAKTTTPRAEAAPAENGTSTSGDARPATRPTNQITPRSPKPKKVAPSTREPERKLDGAFRPAGI